MGSKKYLGRYGVGLKIDSLHGNGSQSWIVFCRGINKYVSNVSEEDGAVHEGADKFSSTGKRAATNPTQAQHQASSSSMRATIPICQRQWISIPAANDCDYDSSAYWLSTQSVEAFVIEINFAKLTEPLNGKSCTLSIVARNPL